MDVLERFEFSQSSLQDFKDCQRRFQLRYIQRLAWPALQAEPARENERHIQRGERFHRMVQQYLLGVPAERLERIAQADEDENLLRWWQNFSTVIPPLLVGTRHVEVTLSAPVLDSYRLAAKYDLVMSSAGSKIIIYDWKTSIRRPRAEVLRQRLQTRVYRYLMVRAGKQFNGGRDVTPEQVEMIYWFAEPDQPRERIPYSLAMYQEDETYLNGLITEIRSLPPDGFRMAPDEGACRFCVYRSLCERGVEAGAQAETEADWEGNPQTSLDFDLEQIGEIGF